MKKIFAIILATVLFVLMVTPVYAALPDPPITPQYNYIDTYSVGLSIDKSTGIASCSASCYTTTNNTVKIEYDLERYMGSYWATVKTWTSSGTSYASLNKSWAVYSGYTYRGFATYSIYNSAGNLLETGSASKSYAYPSN